MRDLTALLESQQIDVDHNTIHRALELNGELVKLKEENEKLKKENRLRRDKEEVYLEELEQREERLAETEAEMKRLRAETSRQKVSLDSVFNDLEESKKLVIKLRKERFDRLFGAESRINDPDPKEESQAQFLMVGKSAQAPSFFSSIGGANSAQQRKIYNLEKENLKLKSELVRLQAQYREESYLNRKVMEGLAEENATAATESLDGSLSLHDESDDSNSTGEGHNRRSNLSRSSSLRRIQEYKERKTSLPVSMMSPRASAVREPQRIGSLRTNIPRGSRMVDSDDDDRPSTLRGGPAGPQRIQSLWPGEMRDQPSRAVTSPTLSRSPRRIQSLQPSYLERSVINLHEVGQDEPSRGSLFGRSESIRRMGWWQ